ncbi:hypothetical protein ABZP36_021052 [Zizania latifolia]
MAFFASLVISLLLLASHGLCYISPGAGVGRNGAQPASTYQTYIVLVDPPPSHGEKERRQWHKSFLSSSTEPRLVHSYSEVFDGFAARLTAAELNNVVSKKPGFIRAFPNKTRSLMTTHMPAFLGLKPGASLWRDVDHGKGVIVGLVDTDIHAAHPSFDNHGIPSSPARWKGSCKGSTARCNNKLISAKVFTGDNIKDEFGHGTHTAGTASENFGNGASAAGLGGGTAARIAPCAHIAMYKACTLFTGTGGPSVSMVTNDASWVLMVIADLVDRSFGTVVRLDSGVHVESEAVIQQANSTSKSYPLLYSTEHHYYDHLDDQKGSAVASHIVVTVVGDEEITAYVTSSAVGNAAASIAFNNTLLGIRPAPVVVAFSSRGPSTVSPGMLKPDILVLGLNILAAYLPNNELGTWPFDVMSGTSMAAPHAIDVAALVKSYHPDWSPIAIKSAILTTLDTTDNTGGLILDKQHQRATVFMTGAGHINPSKAADPGLIYDLDVTEYAGYICALLGDHGLATIVRNSSLTYASMPKIPEA